MIEVTPEGEITMRKRIIVVATCVVAMSAIQSGVARADAGSRASCVGIEVSSISPKGSSDEFPGGVPELNDVVRSFGVPLGAVYSSIAGLHEGSHEACDTATE